MCRAPLPRYPAQPILPNDTHLVWSYCIETWPGRCQRFQAAAAPKVSPQMANADDDGASNYYCERHYSEGPQRAGHCEPTVLRVRREDNQGCWQLINAHACRSGRKSGLEIWPGWHWGAWQLEPAKLSDASWSRNPPYRSELVSSRER